MSSAIPGLAEETDADLLVYMSMVEEEPEAAREAWGEFYQRHAEYLYGVCIPAYASLLGGEEGVADLVASVLKRAFEKAATFDDAGLVGTDEIRRRTRAWLGRIADRLVKAVLRSQPDLPTVFLDQEHWQDVPQGKSSTYSEEMRRRIDLATEVLQSDAVLSNREKEVIRTTMQWYRPEKEHQRLPNDVAADLAAALRITPENVRAIRSRALRKIETFIAKALCQG